LFTEDDWVQAAFWNEGSERRGVTIPRNDLFVATIAVRAKLPVFCRDAHFDAVYNIIGRDLSVEQS
jgi:predicted nucleic acid-binding protein